jgi:prephenate dehydrogenase
LEGLDEASEDLLTESLFCFTTPPGVSGATINALDDLALIFDAHPFFIDVDEHDGLQSGVVGLPDLLSMALLRATVDSPGWEEMRKFAGPSFATATAAAVDDDDVAERCAAIYHNREHIVRRLNVLLTELVSLRDLLSQDDAELVEEAFTKAVEGREQWLRDRERGMWVRDQSIGSEQIPSVGKQLRQMFLGNRFGQHEKDTQKK